MSKFCNNCGTQMDDQSTFCPNCGTASQVAEPAQASAPKADINAAVGKVTDFTQNYVNAAKKNKKLIIIPVAAVAALIAVIVLISLLAGGGYKAPINDYIDMMSGKASKAQIKRMAPKEVWEKMEDETDMDFDDVYDDYKDGVDDLRDNLEDEYGKNVKITYKITDKDKLDKDDLKDIKDELKDRFDISKKKVTAGYELDVDIKIKGREDEDEDEMTFTVVKIGGKWYTMQGLYM